MSTEQSEIAKEYVNYICGANLYFGDNYCEHEVKLEVKYNKKTGKKEDPHSQDRWCPGCKAKNRIHLFPARLCKVLPVEGNSDASLAANKYNGLGVPKDTSGFYGVVPKTHYKTFGTNAQVKVGHNRAPCDKTHGMLVLYSPLVDTIPEDCPLEDVPMDLRDPNDSSMVPLKFCYGTLCFQVLHPNNQGKGVTKGNGVSKGKKRAFEAALDEMEGKKKSRKTDCGLPLPKEEEGAPPKIEEAKIEGCGIIPMPKEEGPESPKTEGSINVNAAGNSELTPIKMGDLVMKVSADEDMAACRDPFPLLPSDKEELKAIYWKLFGSGFDWETVNVHAAAVS